MERILFLALCAGSLIGCSGDSTTGQLPSDSQSGATQLAFLAPTDVKTDCVRCFEPAVAADQQGNIYVAAWRAGGVAVSRDGGASFAIKPLPQPSSPTPSLGGGVSDDIVNIAPWGSLYYTELWSDLGGTELEGIHVVISDDGGDSFTHNEFIHGREQLTSLAVYSDRQWLAFQGDSTVFLLFNCGESVITCMLRSDDRGATWGTARSVVLPIGHSFPSPLGAPAMGADGTLIAPYYATPQALPFGARSIRIAITKDGAIFRQSTVYTHPLGEGTGGGGWPANAILRDGTWVVGWATSDGRLWFSASRDEGASWSAPLVLSPEQSGGASPPWLEARDDGGFDAVWFSDGPGVHVGRFGANLQTIGLAAVPDIGGGVSDYPQFTHLPDGRVATAYLTPDGRLRLAITNR
jgi:hypothetical protein